MKKITYQFVLITIIALVAFSCSEDTEYSITVEYNSNLGTVTPDGVVKVAEGGSKTFDIVPVDGASIEKIVVDHLNVEAISSYTFSSVVADHILEVVFKASNSVLLTNADWLLEGLTLDFTYDGVSQSFDLFTNPELLDIPECMLGEKVSFISDGSYISKPGDNVCEFSFHANGEWVFSDDELKIIMSPYGVNVDNTYTINQLDDQSLGISTIIPLDVQSGLKSLNLSPDEVIDAIMTWEYAHE